MWPMLVLIQHSPTCLHLLLIPLSNQALSTAIAWQVNHVQALWAKPMPPLEEPLSGADRARLGEAAARRTAEVMTRGCAAVLRALMAHRVRISAGSTWLQSIPQAMPLCTRA